LGEIKNQMALLWGGGGVGVLRLSLDWGGKAQGNWKTGRNPFLIKMAKCTKILEEKKEATQRREELDRKTKFTVTGSTGYRPQNTQEKEG